LVDIKEEEEKDGCCLHEVDGGGRWSGGGLITMFTLTELIICLLGFIRNVRI
jgi:hypothetical protein